jgi:hypothetical protein
MTIHAFMCLGSLKEFTGDKRGRFTRLNIFHLWTLSSTALYPTAVAVVQLLYPNIFTGSYNVGGFFPLPSQVGSRMPFTAVFQKLRKCAT